MNIDFPLLYHVLCHSFYLCYLKGLFQDLCAYVASRMQPVCDHPQR